MVLPIVSQYTTYTVQADTMSKFIQYIFNRSYDFFEDTGAGKGKNILYSSFKKDPEYTFEAKKVADFVDGGTYHKLFQELLHNMVKNGILPEGRYYIMT